MKKIELFCGISSLGMPFPRENKNHIGYFDIIKRTFVEQGYDVKALNISSLNKNHTWDFEKTLMLNYDMSKIKNIQIHSIDSLRNTNSLFKLIIPKKVKEKYLPTKEDETIFVKEEYLNSQNPIFIYSAGPNDFFTYIKAGPVELMNKEVRNKLPENLEELVVQCINNVESNWILLHQLNSNVKIMALSFYYSPLYDIIQKIIFFTRKSKKQEEKV